MSAIIPFPFDFKNPDYISVFKWRLDRLKKLRANPELFEYSKHFYKNNPGQFIIDWGCTFDPRNIERGLPAIIPFVLFPRQVEWVDFFMDQYKNKKNSITEKSRDMGVSWLSVALATSMCLFNDNFVAGFGSRKEIYVDKRGDPKSILEKSRMFLRNLPNEFTGNWDDRKHSSHMKVFFPKTKSMIIGEAGDNMGRGDRASIYIVDEFAFVERAKQVDAALSQTTNCRMDVSTPNGTNNPFYEKASKGNIPKFSFHWTDDNRKDQAWYDEQCSKIDDPVIIAQELDLDYSASARGIVIPAIWVKSAIDAHKKLDIEISGRKIAALDVADEGADLNALVGIHGVLVEYIEKWSGKGSDIYETVERSIDICEENRYRKLYYDADGVGAGVKGDARRILKKNSQINVIPFKGGLSVVDRDGEMIEGTENADSFLNLKAQSWWSLRKRFQETYRAVVEGLPFNQDEIISISSSCPDYNSLVLELSQPTYSKNGAGKIIIDKKPQGSKSPNLADALMMVFSPKDEFSYEDWV